LRNRVTRPNISPPFHLKLPIVIDNFIDVDGTALDAHTPDVSPNSLWVQTASNAFYVQGNSIQPNRFTDLDKAVIDTGYANYSVTTTVVPFSSGSNRSDPGIVFRYLDANNYWFLFLETVSSPGVAIANQVVNGVSVQQFNFRSSQIVSGQAAVLRIDCIQQNMIFYLNGVEIVTMTDIYNPLATKAGIFCHKSGSPATKPSWYGFKVTEFTGDYINWPIYTRIGDDTPVIALGTSGLWDDTDINDPNVVWDALNNRWLMAYTGNGGDSVQDLGLAYATSLVGPWTKEPLNPVLSSNPGDINGMNGGIVKKGNTWYSYYCTESAVNISLATSTDLINWTKQGIILTPGANEGPGWTSTILQDPFARLREDGVTIEIWYRAVGQGKSGVSYATSTDGVTFTKNPNNPVFYRPEFAYGTGLGEPAVYIPTGFSENTILITYHGTDINTPTKRFIIDALSRDKGITWKFRVNTLRAVLGSKWESAQVFDPFVLPDTDGRLYLFYGGAPVNGTVLGISIQIGIARTLTPFSGF